jgi:hypothetical protein
MFREQNFNWNASDLVGSAEAKTAYFLTPDDLRLLSFQALDAAFDCMRFFKFSSQIRFKSIFCKLFYVLDSLEPNLAVQKRLEQKLSLFRSAKFGSRSFIVKLYHFRDFPCPRQNRAFLNF